MDWTDVNLLLNWLVPAVVGAVGLLWKSISKLQDRVTKVEATLEALNVGDEIGNVHRRVDEVAATASNIEGQMQQANQTLKMINQHLLEQAAGK